MQLVIALFITAVAELLVKPQPCREQARLKVALGRVPPSPIARESLRPGVAAWSHDKVGVKAKVAGIYFSNLRIL